MVDFVYILDLSVL